MKEGSNTSNDNLM